MKTRTRLIASLACAATALSLSATAHADTFKVTTKKDEEDVKCKKSDCSIREALTAAATVNGRDKIKVPKGKYVLELGQLEVDSEVKLIGAGARKTTIDANDLSRVMDVSAGPTSVSKMKLTGGNSQVSTPGDFPGDAGAVLVVAPFPLTLSQVSIVGNKAQMGGGGVSAPIEGSVATAVKVKRSLIAKNTVSGGSGDGMGGGLAIAGDLSVTNSTIAKNKVQNAVPTNRGGGISVMSNPQAGGGTGITTLTLDNATISKNAISGDAVDGMGGGIGLSDPLMGTTVNINATNSIVAQNKVLGQVEDCGMVSMGVTSKANLSSDESCLFDDDKSITGKKAKLGKLKLNGGQTETMKPKASSPVVDAGVNNGCKSPDQRGVKRPQGKRCDMGAVELSK